MESKLDICEVLNAASRSRQLSSLLQNLFERGAEGCEEDNELVGLAYNLCAQASRFLDKLEEKENK